jgi:hypothetical protein
MPISWSRPRPALVAASIALDVCTADGVPTAPKAVQCVGHDVMDAAEAALDLVHA